MAELTEIEQMYVNIQAAAVEKKRREAEAELSVTPMDFTSTETFIATCSKRHKLHKKARRSY